MPDTPVDFLHLAGQMEEIDRVCRAYPDLADDAFVRQNLRRWLGGVKVPWALGQNSLEGGGMGAPPGVFESSLDPVSPSSVAGSSGLFTATAARLFDDPQRVEGRVDASDVWGGWSLYRTHWVPMNILMVIYSVMGLGLFLDFRLVREWEGAAQPWVILFLIFRPSRLLSCPCSISSPSMPTIARSLREYVLQSFLITLYRPLASRVDGGVPCI